mmetsp:Transcript_47196/g.90091  ORF Transcript_47196/g.90091 Transcript_47196/m.90091 type:complete len:250 (-) Transcript_47196:420-1169(-)
MVGSNGKERVQVGEDLRCYHVGQHDKAHCLTTNQEKREGHRHKVEQEEGCSAFDHSCQRLRIPREQRLHAKEHCAWFTILCLKGVLHDLRARLSASRVALDLECEHFLQGVGHVVVPLPGSHQSIHLHVLEECGGGLLSDNLHITLHQIRITVGLPELVVVKIVVLHVPGLRQHPIQPVQHAVNRSLGERGSMESLAILLAVVSSMGYMVAYHGPACKNASGNQDRGDGVARHDVAERSQGKARHIQYS